MEHQLIKGRPGLLFKGIGVTTFGLVALCYPGQEIHALMMPFGILVTISGLVTIAKNINPLLGPRYRENPLSKKGLGELLIGSLAIVAVLFSVDVFWVLLAAWLIVVGVANANRYRELINQLPEVKVILITYVLSVLFGLFLMVNMIMGLVTLTYEVSGLALLLGSSLIYTFSVLGKLRQYLGNRPGRIKSTQMRVYYDRAY